MSETDSSLSPQHTAAVSSANRRRQRALEALQAMEEKTK